MNRLRKVALLSQISLCYSSILLAQPLEQEGRVFLASELSLKAPAESVSVFVAEQKGEPSLALYVEVDDQGDRPYLVVNGTRQITRPVVRGEGLVLSIDPTDLTINAENKIQLQTVTGSVFPLKRYQVFELNGTIEEVHLPSVFGTASKIAPAQHPSQANYDVEKYSLDLDVTTASRFLSGTVTIDAKSLTNNLATVAVDFSDAGFSGQSLTISAIQLDGTTNLIPTTTVDVANGWVIMTFPGGINKDVNETFSIAITYSGSPGFGQGAFGLETYNRDIRTNSKPVVYTFSEPYGARTWWPCKDVTNDKALLEMTLTTENTSQAISNGTLVSTLPVIGSKTRYHWSHQYPIPPYLIAFSISDYTYNGGTYTGLNGTTTMPVGHYTFSEGTDDPNAYVATIDVIEFFADQFGEYPYINEKYVTVTWGGGFGMEHSTSTSTNKNDLRISNGGGYSRRNVHELAHQWFGDLVTCVNFDHIWLNEGFATYCESLEQERRNGTSAYFSSIQGFLSSGLNDTTPVVNANGDAFQSSLVYRKGAVVLHMLRHVMGDTDFFAGIRTYLQQNAYGNVDTEIFESAMEAQEGTQLDWFFDQWIYGIGKPNYFWAWNQTSTTLQVTINQTTSPFFQMPIDLKLNYSDGSSETVVANNTILNQVFTFPITKEVQSVEFDPEGWIYKGTVTEPAKPTSPILQIVKKNTGGTIEVVWEQPSGSTVDGFRIQSSVDGVIWSTILMEDVLNSSATSATLSTQPFDISYRVLSIESGRTSDPSDPYALAYKSIPDATKILIVDGYDRVQTWSTPNQRFTFVHGEALWPLDVQFDSCANEAIINGSVLLNNYSVVIWQSSEESTTEIPFSTTEQTLVQAFLNQGGKLFVSGSEIGWSHGRAASAVYAPTFYNTYLKSSYLGDDANSYTLSAAAGSVFTGYTAVLDSAGTISYRAEFMDSIAANSGSASSLLYGNGLVAGVQFKGLFPAGTTPGAIVHLGFPFETITTLSNRTSLLNTTLTYFEFSEPNPPNSKVDGFMLF